MFGDGSIKKTTIGAYTYWTVRYYDDGKQKAKRFPATKQGQREAETFLSTIKSKKEKGIKLTTKWTVRTWLSRFIELYKAKTLRKSSLERMIQTYKIIEASSLADIALDRVTGTMIQNFYNQLSEPWTDEHGKTHKPLSSSSISKVHKLLVSAYKKALQQREIDFNVMTTVDPVKVTTKDMTVFSWREIGAIFHAIRKVKHNKHNSKQKHDYRLLFRMLLETGCRIGELLALRWSDIDFKRREIHIHGTKSKSSQEIHEPKTAAGRRKVPIIFDKLLEMLKEARKADGVIKLDGYIFQTTSGGPVNYRRVVECWQHVQTLTGIDKNIHTFRHTCATFLLQRGVPVAETSRILGHSGPEITYKMYVHSVPNFNEKIIEMVSGKSRKNSEVNNNKYKKQVQNI